jgi:hypothetical protein
LPQRPQFVVLVVRFTQAVPHVAAPGPAHTQRPIWQVCPVPQVVPHAPQLVGLFCVVTQAPLQLVCPGRHCARQRPRVHTWPAAQALPQAPQLLTLVWRFTHTPLQSDGAAPPGPPVAGAQAQMPARHVAPPVQTTPQAPQLLLSVPRVVHEAPQRSVPAAHDDAVAAYRYLLAEGIAPERIVIAGDSAGGAMVLNALRALRDAGLPLPAAGVAISPWVDLSCSGASFESNAGFDFVGKVQCQLAAKGYLAGLDAKSPEVSPLYAGLKGLPPLLVHAGDAEVLIDQIRAFVARARSAGVCWRAWCCRSW